MPTREYRGFDLPTEGGGVGISVPGPVRASAQQANLQTSGLYDALQGVLQIGKVAAEKSFDNAVQEEYIEGMRQRSLGTALEDIESNVFTAPFIRGGYEAQDFRIQQAEMANELNQLIQGNGRTLPPEEFAKLLSERTGPLLEGLRDSMSTRDRASAIASQAQLEQSILRSQASEHAKYAIEQAGKRVVTQGNQINAELTSASNAGDEEAYTEASARMVLYFDDILNGDSIPEPMRADVARDYLLSVLSNDNVGIVEELRDAGALDNMSAADRVKIDTAIREANSRTLASRSIAAAEFSGQMFAKLAAGELTNPVEVRAWLQAEVDARRMTVNEMESVWKQFYKTLSDTDTVSNVFSALDAGDIGAIHAEGYTTEEALLLRDQALAQRGMGLSDRIISGLQRGLPLGTVPRQFGQQIGAAIAASVSSDQLNPDQVSLLTNMMAVVKQVETRRPGSAAQLVQSIPEQQRSLFQYALDAADLGIDPATAMRTAAGNAEEFASMEEFRRRQHTVEFQKLMTERVQELYGNTFWRNMAGRLTTGETSSQDVWNQAQLSMHVQSELNHLTKDPNNIGMFYRGNEESLLKVAAANVQGRTMVIGSGGRFGDAADTPRTALVLPRGVSVQSVFGTSDSESIGQELANLYPPAADGYTSAFKYDRVLGLVNLQIDEDGRVVNGGGRGTPVDAMAVGASVQRQTDELVRAKQAGNFGEVLTVDAGEDTPVRMVIDGVNTAGVDRTMVQQWRKSLLEAEGLRLQAYADREGVAVGVGKNVTGEMEVGERITVAVAEELFRESSDEALNAGVRIGRRLGVTNPHAQLALAGAAFQLGEAGLGQFRDTAAAIQARDWPAFEAAVRDSAWYEQTPDRANQFITRMRPHFLGTGVRGYGR